MSEDLRRAYFKGLRLGDAVIRKPRLTLSVTQPAFQASGGGTRAYGTLGGPAAKYVVDLEVSFIRNFSGDETIGAFHDRVRQFFVDILAAVSLTPGHSPAGPLCFVRSPLGQRFGLDRSTINNGSGITEGDGVTVDLDDDVGAVGWTDGQVVLFVSPGNVSTYDWELAEILDVPTGTSLEVDLAYPKQDADEVYRVEWYMPEVALSGNVTTDSVSSTYANEKSTVQIPLQFSGVLDVVQGALP